MKNKQKRKKELTPQQQERIITKEYFDRIAPGVVRFYTDHYICGMTQTARRNIALFMQKLIRLLRKS